MQWKRKISGFLAAAMLAGSLPAALAWDAPANDWAQASRDGVKARFFVGSDTHIGRNADAKKKLENALDVFYTVDKDADGVLLVGDITNNGSASEYQTLMQVINESEMGKAGKVVLSMGNHEFNSASGAVDRFKSATEQEPSEVLYYDEDGNATAAPGNTLAATVIKLSAKNYAGDYTDNYDMVETALETASEKNPGAPVIVMGHHGIPNTAYVTNEWYGSYGNMVDLFEQYPQVIHISGHSHATLEDARSIYQDEGYTAIQDGTIGAYFENEKGKVSPSTGSSATRPDNSEIASQALRIDVMTDNTVEIYRMNLTTGEYMYEPWTFNQSGSLTDRPYDETRTGNAPSFDEGAAVTASDAGEKEVTVHFPAALAASGANNDMVHSYEITLTPQDGGSAVTRAVFADYYEAEPKSEWSVKVTGLAAGKTYDVSVSAATSFGNESEAITGTASTAEAAPYETPEPDVLNMDYRTGSNADANGHALTVKGAPELVTDETYGTVYRFDGSDDGLRYTMSAADYNQFKDGYTMELLVKINGSKGNPFSCQEGAGCGFELNSNGKTLEFWNHVGGYKKPTVDISALKDGWIHMLATFDGSETKLYVNGELKSTVQSAGSMTVPSSGARYFYVGADTNGSGSVQNPMACDVALARLYSGAMNAEDAAKAYEAATQTGGSEQPETVKADVLDVNFASGSANDQSANGVQAVTKGSPALAADAEMGNIAKFNGQYDAYTYALDDEDYAKMTQMTIETVFKMDEIPASGEHEVFSNQQSGGVGIGVEDGEIILYCHAAGGYKTPTAPVKAGQWYHVVGTYDGQTVKLYVNGALAQSIAAPGSLKWPAASSRYFAIGGDSSTNGNVQYFSKSDVARARLYSTALTEAQVADLYQALDPAVLTVSGDTGRMQVSAETGVPTVTASNGREAALTGITVNSQSVLDTEYNVETGKLTPATIGSYTFTYTLGSQVKTITRDCVEDLTAQVNLGVVAVDTMAEGVQYNVAVHANRGQDSEVAGVAFDLKYDADKFEYIGKENVSGTVSEGEGVLHFEKTGLSEQEFKNYAATRLAKLTFRVKDGVEAGEASFTIENVQATDSTPLKANRTNKTVELLAQSVLDLNGDGVIGAGDVALAGDTEQAKAIAQLAAIYPYKHAVVITMDGGGICFRPDQMYYAANGQTTLTSDPDILAKRTNTYAMELFNEYCAASYSARSETPTISAQNYTSIIHGKEYATADAEYKIDNTATGTYYYPDFGKQTPVYPSVFAALGRAFPNRGNAAFAEWTQIVNGIVEPDTAVYTHASTKNTGDMQDVADYIRSDAYQNTAMVYMQSDYMDAVGHGHGYYTDYYYQELPKYDAYFKEIMDALEETGTKDDTLVLFTADHGGTIGGSHGGTTNQEYDVQIALGGQTIDSGKTLSGGTNHDIPQLVLAALRGEAPVHMDGSAALFEQASLPQDELVKKGRDIEKVTFNAVQGSKNAVVTLGNAKQAIRAADMVVDLDGRTLAAVDTAGEVVRQEEKGGKLYLTVRYAEQPETLATLRFDENVDAALQMEEIMLGAADGSEIYCDLANTNQAGEVPSAGVQASVSGPANVTLGETLPFAFSLAKMERVVAATLEFEVSDASLVQDGKLTGLNGFKNVGDIQLEERDGKLVGKATVSLLNNTDGLTRDEMLDIARLTFADTGAQGEVKLKLTGITVAGFDENGEAVHLDSTITVPEAAIVIGSKYDVNGDGVIDLRDIVYAQQFYQMGSMSANWAQAKRCDVNGDNIVDIEDLTAILYAYSA